MSKQRPTYDGGKQKMSPKPKWTPSETEAAVLDGLEAGEILKLIHTGGAEKEKVRRWWMAKNPGSDVAAYFRQIIAWENEDMGKRFP